ncbi:MAG: ornithine cyclodeaminase family protein [Rhodanobacteraceae bacterium]
MIVLSDDDLDRLPIMALALEAMEDAFRERSRGKLVSPPRFQVPFGAYGNLVFTVGGKLDTAPVAGFRVYNTFHGPDSPQLTVVWSADHAELLGVIAGSRLGQIRTGAIGGIAIRYMSSPSAKVMGIIGSGPQARSQLEAAASVRDLELVRVFSRNEQSRTAFAQEMSTAIGIRVEASRSAHAAVDGADIVTCATDSPTPVLDARWLKPGVHLNTLGPKTLDRHELGWDVAEMADVIATDSREQVCANGVPFFLSGSGNEDRIIDLAEIVSGKTPARKTGTETTLFCSVGLAGTEVMLASRLLTARDAKRRN